MQFTLYIQNILMENFQPVDGFRIRFSTFKHCKIYSVIHCKHCKKVALQSNCNATSYRLLLSNVTLYRLVTLYTLYRHMT